MTLDNCPAMDCATLFGLALEETARDYATSLTPLMNKWKLANHAYEGGPGWGVGETVNIGNRIESQRHPLIKESIKKFAKEYFDRGFGHINIYGSDGAWNRFGPWGTIENIQNVGGPKWEAYS